MKDVVKALFVAAVLCVLAPSLAIAAGTGEAAKKPVVLSIWSTSEMKPLVEYVQELEKQFNLSHKDYQVKVDFKADQGYEQLLMTTAAAKTGPDVFYWWAGPFTNDMASRGALLDLTTAYPKEMWDTALGVEYVTVEGKRYAVPIELYYEVLMYNRELFKKAGLDPNKFPETWDQLMDACAKLKAIGVAPFAFANKEGYIADVLVEGFTIQKFKDAEDMKKTLIGGSFAEPRYLEGLARVKELYDKGYLFEGGISEPYSLYTSQVISGQAAIARGTGRFLNEVRKQIGDVMGLAIYPKWVEGGLAGIPKIGLNTAWYVSAYTKYPAQAVEVLKNFTSRESFNSLYKIEGTMPATKNWDASLISDPETKSIIEKAKKLGTAPEYYPLYPTSEIYDALTKYYSLYLLGQITAEQFGQNIDAARSKN
jgi:ABC-type glycerol-3-phosphate transport system substrate-binding protein